MNEPVEHPHHGPRRRLLGAGLVAALTALAFLPAVRNQLVNWDDPIYVGGHAPIWTAFGQVHPSGNWHPLAVLSHRLDDLVWGEWPGGHHLTSIIFHAINAGLVVLLGCSLLAASGRRNSQVRFSDRQASMAVAVASLLWAIHPLRVESVAWVSERKDLLCGLFYLLGLLAYLRYTSANPEGRRWYSRRSYWAIFACLAGALMSKPMAVSFPVVLLILDWVPLARLKQGARRCVLVEKIPFLLLSAIAALVALHAQRMSGAYRALADLPAALRAMVAVRAAVAYLGKALWPTPLLPYYSYPRDLTLLSSGFAIPALFLLAIVIVCVASLRRRPAIFAAFAVYAALLLPVLGIVQVGPQAMADRYTYLSSIPLAYLLAAAIATVLSKLQTRSTQLLLGAAAVVAIAALGALTFSQIAIWHDSDTLWTHELRYEPQNMEAHNSRASHYYEMGLFEKALADYDAALASPAQVSAKHSIKRRAACFNDRAITQVALGRLQQAVADETQAILLMPRQRSYYLNRSKMYHELGMADAARADWDEAQRLSAGTGLGAPR